MKSIKQTSHHNFLSINLRKYIDKHLYELKNGHKIYKFISHIDSQTIRRWSKLPVNYLTATESLALGTTLAFGPFLHKIENINYFKKVVGYFDYSLDHSRSDSKIRAICNTSLGVLFFEKALLEDRKKQRKYLILAKFYLNESLSEISKEEKAHKEINLIYLTLVHVSLGELYQGIHSLHKAAKVSLEPISLWRILANIYKNLNMPRVQQYYENKCLKMQFS